MPQLRTSLVPVALGLLAATFAACGGSNAAFSTRYPDNNPSHLAAVQRRLASAQAAPSPAIAVGVTRAPIRIFAYDMQAQRMLWSEPSTTTHAPIVTGKYVVTQETGGVVVRDLLSGRERAVIDNAGMTLNGAAAEGTALAVTLTRGSGTYAESTITLLRDGSVDWQRPLRFTAGSPNVIGGMVLVPWGNQNVTVLDAGSGDEIARIRLTDHVVGHVVRRGSQVFGAGTQGFVLLDGTLTSGRARDAAFFEHQERDLPGRPRLIRDSFALGPMPAADSAEQRIRLSWLPTASNGQATLEDDRLYLSFYRFVFGLTADGSSARWVHLHEADVIGATAQPGGVLVADDTGRLMLLNAEDGQPLWQTSTGLASTAVSFAFDATPIAAGNGIGEPASARQQLVAAAEDPDARLVPGRILAVQMLGTLPDAAATSSLVALCEQPRLTAAVRTAACAALSKRSMGTEEILSALARHGNYLDNTPPPPVGPLASAAVIAQLTAAAPALIAHLQDPHTAGADLKPLVAALGDLGATESVDALIAFLRQYHADANDDHLLAALKQAVDVIAKLDPANAMTPLTEIGADAFSHPSLRQYAIHKYSVLEEAAAAQAAAEAQAEADANPTDEAADGSAEAAAETTPTPAVPAGPPPRLTLGHVQKVLAPVVTELRACLKAADRQYHSARIVIVVEDGSLLTVAVTPQAIQSCIEPLVRRQTFPRTLASRRERIDYTLNER